MSLVPVQAPIAREALVEAYLSARQANGDLTSKDSARPVRSILRRFLEMVGDRLPDVHAEDVEAWLAAQASDKPATVRARVTIVRPFCRWLVANGHALADPTADIDVGKRWSRGRERFAPVVEVVDLVPVHLPDAIPVCGDCGRPTDRPRRLSGVGRPLCTVCYQRARRAADADSAFGVSVRLHLRREMAGLGLAPRTFSQYANACQTAERWFAEQGWHLAAALPWQVVAYLDTRPSSWACRNLMRAAFKTYWELGGHPKPPLRAVRVPPKPEMTCRALDDEDAQRLAMAARERGDRHGLAVVLGLYQAMRREEIATTRWDAVDESGWLTVIGKGSKTRRIPLHCVAPDHGRGADEGATGQRGRERVGLPRPLRRAGEPGHDLGVGSRTRRRGRRGTGEPHWLRHTCLATQNDATGDLRAVQAFARSRGTAGQR